MAEWTRNKVDSDQLNNGQEYTINSNVSREQLNSMVNAGLYAQDFVGKMVENIDTSDVANVGTPSVEIVDGDGATSEKPYKKFKFANLKGEQGETGNGILSVQKTSTSGLVDTYTITFTDDSTATFTVTNGEKGEHGDAGDIYQTTGTSTTGAMSQDATTKELKKKLDVTEDGAVSVSQITLGSVVIIPITTEDGEGGIRISIPEVGGDA